MPAFEDHIATTHVAFLVARKGELERRHDGSHSGQKTSNGPYGGIYGALDAAIDGSKYMCGPCRLDHDQRDDGEYDHHRVYGNLAGIELPEAFLELLLGALDSPYTHEVLSILLSCLSVGDPLFHLRIDTSHEPSPQRIRLGKSGQSSMWKRSN